VCEKPFLAPFPQPQRLNLGARNKAKGQFHGIFQYLAKARSDEPRPSLPLSASWVAREIKRKASPSRFHQKRMEL
jgi:hypothetical protein